MKSNGCQWGTYCDCHGNPRNASICCRYSKTSADHPWRHTPDVTESSPDPFSYKAVSRFLETFNAPVFREMEINGHPAWVVLRGPF